MASEYFVFPQIDPVIVSLGSIGLRWYGLAYLLGIIAAWWLAKQRLNRIGWTKDQLSDFLFWGFLGVVLGGRFGYVLFYQFEYFLQDPFYLVKIWQGGMSFHGGLLGVILAIYLYARKQTMSVLQLGDFVAPIVPLGLGSGRIANFINGELWGRTTDVPWAIIFPAAGPEPRHPSQLYQVALEGVLLFAILWLFSKKPRPTGAVAGLFLLTYGVFRFFVEYFREPDAHIGLYADVISQGQILCIPMILAGFGMMVFAYRKADQAKASQASKGK